MPADEKKEQLSAEDIKALNGLLNLIKYQNDNETPGAQAAKAAGETARDQGTNSIDLIDLFWFLLSKIKYIILACLIGALLGGVYGYTTVKPVYTSTSKLYILNSNSTSISISDLQLGNMLTMDYKEVFKTWEVHEMVRQELGLNYSYGQLQSMISISNPENTRVLYITARCGDAQLACDIANAYANAGKKFIMQTMEATEPNTFSVALVPGSSVGQSKSSYITLGFGGGLALSAGILILIYLLDDRPKSSDGILKATGMNTLAVIPEFDDNTGKKKGRKVKKGGRHKK